MIIIINNNMIINMINNNINNNNIIMILITTATATGRFSQVLRSASTSYRCQVCSQVTSLLNSTEGNSAAHQTIKQCHIALTLLVSVGVGTNKQNIFRIPHNKKYLIKPPTYPLLDTRIGTFCMYTCGHTVCKIQKKKFQNVHCRGGERSVPQCYTGKESNVGNS